MTGANSRVEGRSDDDFSTGPNYRNFIGKAAAVVGLALLVSGCQPQAQASKASDPIKPVKLFTLSTSHADDVRTFPGEIVPASQAKLSFKVSGQVQDILVTEGDEIKAGDVVARLDPTDYQVQVDLAKANYDLAQAQYTRFKAIARQNAATAAQLDEARASLAQAKINLTNAKNQLAYTTLVAPYDGTVGNVFIEPNEFVAAANPVVMLMALDTIDLEFNIPSDLVAEIEDDKTTYQPLVKFDAIDNRSFRADIRGFVASSDPGTRSYKAILTMPMPAKRLGNILPGMSATLTVELNELTGNGPKPLLVPAEAVFSHGNQPIKLNKRQVWRYQNEQVRLVNVGVGRLQGNFIEITAGLKPGDQVVTAGVQSLYSGQTVKPWVPENH